MSVWEWFKGFRTVAINSAIALVVILSEVMQWASGFYWNSIFSDPKTASLVTIGVAVLNILLRFITTTPPFKKEG